MSTQMQRIGMVGAGAGADSWDDLPDAVRGPITGLAIGSGDVVDSIQVLYGNYHAPLRGTDLTARGNAPKHVVIAADDPLIAISGEVLTESYGTFLTNLRFKTLKGNTFGPYGQLNGQPFVLDAPPGAHFVGLFGTTGWTSYGMPRWVPAGIGATLNNAASSLIGGGTGMSSWDDDMPGTSAQGAITSIRIGSGDVVDSLQVTYGSYQAPLRGTDLSALGNPPKQIVITADDPIVEIDGVVSTSEAGTFLSQLRFKTLKGHFHGPYGLLNGQGFVIKAPAGTHVSGFFGTTGWTNYGSPRWYPSGLGVAFSLPATR